MLGILLTSMPLRVLEVSRSGCLLESGRHIPAGTSGRLQLDIDGRPYSEEVRVTRCHRIEGAGASYRLGVEFLRTGRPDSSSLRRAVYSMLNPKHPGVVGRGPEATDEDLEADL